MPDATPVAPSTSTVRAERPSPPGLGRASLSRARVELLRFVRSREEMAFTFALPVVMLLLLGTALDFEIDDAGTNFRGYLVAGILATVPLNVGVNSLTIQLAQDRTDGTIKRLAGTPMPPAAYLMGKLALVTVVAVLQAVAVLATGRLVLGADLPDADGWLTLAWAFPLGLVACTLAGMALSTRIADVRSASAIVTLPFIVLQFISGVFFVFTDLPGWIQSVASVFPLRWLALAMREAMLPDFFETVETGGTWQLDTVAIVLGAWVIGGSILVLRSFRIRGER